MICVANANPVDCLRWTSPTGTLQQAVLTECIASEVLAIPLLLMTRAHATCDWALVLSLCIFGVSAWQSTTCSPCAPCCARTLLKQGILRTGTMLAMSQTVCASPWALCNSSLGSRHNHHQRTRQVIAVLIVAAHAGHWRTYWRCHAHPPASSPGGVCCGLLDVAGDPAELLAQEGQCPGHRAASRVSRILLNSRLPCVCAATLALCRSCMEATPCLLVAAVVVNLCRVTG